MDGAELPHVNYSDLVPGVVYAIRPEHLMSLKPAMYLGRCWHRLQDGRVVRGRAWAMPGQDGWWRPTWAWGLKMRWDDYLALPEAERPL
ncbi:MAG: hypothetical protein DLM67_00830 [Candidatus Nephthysia bennettiae]|uniref:Uncharacterized protein n=1 Tax=Candidatus Nephthysia bennettiae TaxID=3127016 RepID=A0A934K968_9BACT|nr:hypothetical protein [Candidatus Dormibacteraeota bacterium]PZS00694.1 MAG: hypothetical protein DLM67_00830 [Candidatus Dormibacteraeota bacterium]